MGRVVRRVVLVLVVVLGHCAAYCGRAGRARARRWLGLRGGGDCASGWRQAGQRSFDVLVHRPLGALGLTRAQLLEQQRVRPGHKRKVWLAPVIALGVHDEPARIDRHGPEHFQQQPVVGACVDQLVELEVERDELVRLFVLPRDPHLLDNILEQAIVAVGEVGHRQACCQPLQLSAYVLNRNRVLERDAGDEGATIRQAGQQALVFQAANGLAHWLPTDAEAPRQIDLQDPLTRLESTVQDFRPQRIANLMPQRTSARHALERVHAGWRFYGRAMTRSMAGSWGCSSLVPRSRSRTSRNRGTSTPTRSARSTRSPKTASTSRRRPASRSWVIEGYHSGSPGASGCSRIKVVRYSTVSSSLRSR